MAFKFFTIPIRDSQSAEAELNAFLSSHKVLTVERQWVEDGPDSFWALCVDFIPSATSSQRSPGRAKVDYKEVLSAEDFRLFAKLRDWRKAIAKEEAVPIYMIFTNEQLAEIAQRTEPAAFRSCSRQSVAGKIRFLHRPVLVAKRERSGRLSFGPHRFSADGVLRRFRRSTHATDQEESNHRGHREHRGRQEKRLDTAIEVRNRADAERRRSAK